MATKDPNSRPGEGNANTPYGSPYAPPNGAAEQPPVAGTSPRSSSSDLNLGAQHEETAGERIGRFFRRAMERLSGRDDDDWRRGNERNNRDRDTEDRYRRGDPSWQYGRSALRDRGQSEWRDLGRSRDDRSEGHRAGLSEDTGPGDERLQGSGSAGYGRGIPEQSYGERPWGMRPVGTDENRSGLGAQGQAPSWRGSVGQPGAAQAPWRSENRGEQTLGEQALGHSPSDTGGLAGLPREIGGDRDFESGYGREEWNRRWERRGERSAQSRPSGLRASYGGGADEDRAREADESWRDRDQGQGRRFWQREPLAARDVMTRMPKTVTRHSAMREAAVIMRDENCGVVPVVDSGGRLQGILTDRDMVIRGLVAENGQLPIEEVMTDDVSAVTEDEPLTSVLDLMGRKQVRRVPVVDRNDRLLGIISMADIANRADYDEDLQDAFERISSRRSFWSLFS